MSHTRIDIPIQIVGGALEEVFQGLEERGYRARKLLKRKDPHLHLSSFEIQFYMRSHKVTFGITDFEKKKRVHTSVHGYVRASPTIMEDAVTLMKELLVPWTWSSKGKKIRTCHSVLDA